MLSPKLIGARNQWWWNLRARGRDGNRPSFSFALLPGGADPSHAMDPANAFTFQGAVGDGRALFGSTRGERPQANKAHLSSVPSPWALPGGGSDACAHSSSAAPAGTANLHAIGRLLDPCVCALLRHVGSVLIEIGSAPRGCSSGDDDERGEMGGVSGVGNSAVERG